MMCSGIVRYSFVLITCVVISTLITQGASGKTWTTEERDEVRRILEQLQTNLRGHGKHRVTARTTVLTTISPRSVTSDGSPNMQSGFYDSIYKCPILEHLLFQYFQGFPNISKANDDVHFSTRDFDASLVKSIGIFTLLNGNVRVTVDELTENFARIVLDKRINCPVTMFQQMLVYALRSELNSMMAKDGKSLKHHVLLTLKKNIGGARQQDLELVAQQIVVTVNYIVFESLVSYLQFEEFESLDWFLGDFTSRARSLFVKNQNKKRLYSDLKNSLQNAIQNYPTAMQCTSLPDLIQLHSRLTSDFAKQFIELEQSGMVMHLAKNVISEMLKYFGSSVSSTSLDKTAKQLATITVNFMKAKIEVLRRYEKEIISLSNGNPPDFLVKRLSPEEKRSMMELLKNITTQPRSTTQPTISGTTAETKSTTPSGQKLPLTLRELHALFQMDAHNLRKLNYWLVEDQYTGSHKNHVFQMIRGMINIKEALIHQILKRIDQS